MSPHPTTQHYVDYDTCNDLMPAIPHGYIPHGHYAHPHHHHSSATSSPYASSGYDYNMHHHYAVNHLHHQSPSSHNQQLHHLPPAASAVSQSSLSMVSYQSIGSNDSSLNNADIHHAPHHHQHHHLPIINHHQPNTSPHIACKSLSPSNEMLYSPVSRYGGYEVAPKYDAVAVTNNNNNNRPSSIGFNHQTSISFEAPHLNGDGLNVASLVSTSDGSSINNRSGDHQMVEDGECLTINGSVSGECTFLNWYIFIVMV